MYAVLSETDQIYGIPVDIIRAIIRCDGLPHYMFAGLTAVLISDLIDYMEAHKLLPSGATIDDNGDQEIRYLYTHHIA